MRPKTTSIPIAGLIVLIALARAQTLVTAVEKMAL
jgi:hypothetical protein